MSRLKTQVPAESDTHDQFIMSYVYRCRNATTVLEERLSKPRMLELFSRPIIVSKTYTRKTFGKPHSSRGHAWLKSRRDRARITLIVE